MMKKKRFSFIKFILFILIICLIISFIMFFINNLNDDTNNMINNNNNNNNNIINEKDSYLNHYVGGQTYSSDWKLESNVGKLNMNVASGVREKRTKILVLLS